MVGKGANTDFWSDNWTNMGPLNEVFPWIFALVLVKEGPVLFFGHMDQGGRGGTFNFEDNLLT